MLEWPWVKFYAPKRKLWVLGETKYMVDREDVKLLPPPEIVMKGRRVYYNFVSDLVIATCIEFTAPK